MIGKLFKIGLGLWAFAMFTSHVRNGRLAAQTSSPPSTAVDERPPREP